MNSMCSQSMSHFMTITLNIESYDELNRIFRVGLAGRVVLAEQPTVGSQVQAELVPDDGSHIEGLVFTAADFDLIKDWRNAT